MPISYYYHFQDENPQQIGGEVPLRHYIGEKKMVSNMCAESNRMTIYLDSSGHECMVVEMGPPVTVTFRRLHGR